MPNTYADVVAEAFRAMAREQHLKELNRQIDEYLRARGRGHEITS